MKGEKYDVCDAGFIVGERWGLMGREFREISEFSEVSKVSVNLKH